MKLCWDNLEKSTFTKNGNFIINQNVYYLKSCEDCGEDYLGSKKSKYCSRNCSNKNSFKGKFHTEKTKQILSKMNSGKNHPQYGKREKDSHNYGIKRSKDSRKLMSIAKKGKKSNTWKGGITEKNVPWYDTYEPQLSYVEECRKTKEGYLEVKCTYCGKWFLPTKDSVWNRIGSLNGNYSGENRIYCSDSCKKECPIYRQRLYPKGFKKATSREVQPELRQMVMERDNWTCQKCGKTKNLHCHHFEGIHYNPIESADVDMCVTLCKWCHVEIHKEKDCRYKNLTCKEEKEWQNMQFTDSIMN